VLHDLVDIRNLALATGARRGELCALSGHDVDFEAQTVTIARSLSQTKNRVELKGTKTGSIRRLALSRLAIDALRRQRAAQAQDKLRARGEYLEDGAFSRRRSEAASPRWPRRRRLSGSRRLRLSQLRGCTILTILWRPT
jgi:integrase